MKRVSLVIRTELREMKRSEVFGILTAVAVVLAAVAAIAIPIVLRTRPWLGHSGTEPILELVVGLVFYFLPLFIVFAFTWAFTGEAIAREKVAGITECLLATPLDPKLLWLGKSLAIFLPAYGLAILGSLVVAITINVAAVVPALGVFVLPPAAMVTGLVLNPLFFFALHSFSVLFALARNPDIAAVPAILVAFVLMHGVPLGLGMEIFDFAAWSFAGWYLGATVAAWAVVLSLSGMLKKERIVLSARGS